MEQINIYDLNRPYEQMLSILCDSSTLQQNKGAMAVLQNIQELKSNKRTIPFEEMQSLVKRVVMEIKKDVETKEKALFKSIENMKNELTKAFCITEARVPASQFPRYEYLLNNLLDAVTRYRNIFRLDDNANVAEPHITFYYYNDIEGNETIIDRFLHKATGNAIETTNINSFEDLLKSTENAMFSCFVVTGNMQPLLKEIGNMTTANLIVARSDRECRVISRSQSSRHQKNVFVLSSDESKKIDTILEECLLQNLKLIFEEVKRSIETTKRAKTAGNAEHGSCFETNSGGKRKTVSCSSPNQSQKRSKLEECKGNHLHSSKQKQAFPKETPLQYGDKPKVPSILCINQEMLLSTKKETRVWLLQEIIGLFHMSNACIEDHEYRERIELKKVSRDLFTKFKEIHGVGYRMQKLQIVVKDGQGMDTEEKQRRLHDVLHQLNVYEYEVVQMSLKNFLTSGDDISVGGNSGSFGCFAETRDGSDGFYGLFSKHVAPKGQNMEMRTSKDNEQRSVGRIVQETLADGGLDIAAVKLSIPKSQCDTRFKSARGIARMPNKDHAIPKEMLEGQKVHMWGTKSKPGKGIITIPEYECAGMDHTLIQVEDIVDGEGTVDNRFAQSGDSGAIACTDVPGQEIVNPISMNMGCLNYKDVEQDDQQTVKKKRGRYLTVPLPSGLQVISKRIGKNIDLC